MSNDYNGKKRSELPDSVFGIPQERKYPMPDEKHTRSAIKLFNHVDPKYEEQLAKAVVKNMKKYGIDGSVVGPNNRLRKYLPKNMIKESMDSLLYKYMYTDNDPDIIIQESGYALTWRITPILLKAALSGVDQYDYKYLREKTLPAILKKCKTMDDIKYMRRDAIAAKTQLEILKRNVHVVNTNDEQIMKRLSKSFIKKVKDGKITEKEIDTHIRWLGTEYKKLIDARAKEIRDSMKESYIEEGYFKSDKDIYYNKDKFDSGEINICFITGLSGSGKSTMGRNMSSKNIEHYEMDDVICNDNFSDDNLKEYGGLISSFFKGSGKSFRLIRDNDKHNDSVFNTHKNYEKEITQAFVKHAISYCKSHKETKYVCDGIWIFMFIKPEQLKDCAVYIKGTSSIKSGYRALKRDIDEDKRNGMTSLQIFKHEFKRVKEDILYARENQKELKSFRSYFEKQSTNESVSSTVSKDHKQKGYISLSSLKKVHITESVINKYKKEYPVLRHVRYKDTNEYICDGYMWFKENDLVCYVGSCQYTDDDTKWIISLEIISKYRGYGLSNQILDYCVKSMKCKYLSVNKNNELAKKIYDKYGFRVYYEDNTMYYMTIDKSIKESSILPQDTGISTVIFDMGDVLVSANIQDYLMTDPEIPNEIIDELLKIWFIDKDEVDDTMDLDTYREIINKRMGTEFSKYIPKLFRYNTECVTAFDYTIPMIQDLKDKGYKVYYLSNWSAWTHDLLQEAGKFDFLKLMDGGVFSYDAGYMKPDEEIYKILLNKYKINPEEAIFFDDKEENIEAANKLGIHGVHFPRHDSSIVYNSLKVTQIAHEIACMDIEIFPNGSVIQDDDGSVKVKSYNKRYHDYNTVMQSFIEAAKKEGFPISIKNGNDRFEYSPSTKEKPYGEVGGVSISKGGFTKETIQESVKTQNQIGNKEIKDIKTVINSIEDDGFNYFKFKDIIYCDIRYRDKTPIAFITIRVKSVNNSTVGFVSLAVNPKYQNQGIEKSLTAKAISWFKQEKGINFLEWHCLQNNEDSKKLANDVGFRVYIAKNSNEYIQYTMESSINEYGTTGGTMVGSNQPDSVYIVNYMQNNIFSGYKEPKQAICKKGFHQMFTTKNGKAIPVDIDDFKEIASDIEVFRFKEQPILSYDKIIEAVEYDREFYTLLTGETALSPDIIKYDNRFVQEENFFDELDNIKSCVESTILGLSKSEDYPYIKLLGEAVDGRSYNYYRDIDGVFVMNELSGVRSESYDTIEDIPKDIIDLIKISNI